MSTDKRPETPDHEDPPDWTRWLAERAVLADAALATQGRFP
ncbi:hypothetical protein [Nonomuraea sp. GTA35]